MSWIIDFGFKAQAPRAKGTQEIGMGHHNRNLSPWDTRVVSVAARFPGMSGRILQNKIWELYVIESSTPPVPFFDDRGARNFSRHRLNDREQRDTVAQYAKGVRESGMLMDVRGKAWAVLTSYDGPKKYEIISAATLIEAVYKAAWSAQGLNCWCHLACVMSVFVLAKTTPVCCIDSILFACPF